MDRLIMVLSHANVEVIKEPRGFIKFIQIIIAICAFATAVSNHSSTGFKAHCPNDTTAQRNLEFYYPYNLHESTRFEVPLCNMTTKEGSAACYGDYTSSSQFFVFVGVTAFLYCLFELIFYILADDKYHQVALIPSVDFVVTLVYGALWFVCSSAWADAVVKIKHYTDPNTLFLDNDYNRDNLGECISPSPSICTANIAGDYRNMNISIVLGYLCSVVWFGNLWFLYKETKWYKDKMNVQQNNSENVPPSSPSSVI